MEEQKKMEEQKEQEEWKKGINRITNRIKATSRALVVTLILNTASFLWTPLNKNNRLDTEWKTTTERIIQNWKELLSWNEITFEVNEDGSIIEKIVHPWDLKIKKELPEESRTKTVTVHYEVAPKFEDSESIDAEKYEAIRDSIELELNKSLKETLIWFDFVKQNYEWEIGNTKYTIVINGIEWHASPEWYKFWDESLKPWHYENENKNAAERRAKDAEPIIKEAFLKFISENPELSSQIDTSSITITWSELQITQEEYDKLDSLRTELWYKDIVTMIEDNNSWKVTDADAAKLINEIINSKRNVIITYTIKWHPNDIFVIPILIFPIPIFKRKKKWTEWWEINVINEGEWWETNVIDEGEWWETNVIDEGEWWETNVIDEGEWWNWWGWTKIDDDDNWPPKYKKRKDTDRRPLMYDEQISSPWRQQTWHQRKQPRKDRAHNYSSARQLRNYERRDWKWSKMSTPNKNNSTGRRNWSRK